MQDCAEAMNAESSLDPESLLCKPCTLKDLGFGVNMCKKHGNAYIDWKCQFCCSLAQWTCGSAYYCTPCHNDRMSGKLSKKRDFTVCVGGKDCPLSLEYHPQASHSRRKAVFPLGCSICRSERLEEIETTEKDGFNWENREAMKQRFG